MKQLLFIFVTLTVGVVPNLLYGYTTVTREGIMNYGVNYTVGRGFICALTNDGKVICDGDNNKFGQQNVPLLSLPVTQLAAGDSHVCALDSKGVVCWGRGFDSNGQRMALATNPNYIAAGYDVTCASDELGLECVGNDSSHNISGTPKVANAKYIVLNDSGGCALGSWKREVACWGPDFADKSVPGKSDLESAGVSQLSGFAYPAGRLCFITDDYRVTCWYGSSFRKLSFGDVGDVYALASSTRGLCVIGENGASCRNTEISSVSKVSKIRQIKTIAGGPEGFCAAGPVGDGCWGDDSLSNISKVSAVMKANFPGRWLLTVQSIEEALINVKEYVYAYKARFLDQVAQYLARYKIDDSEPLYFSYKKVLVRALVINALNPFILDLTYESLYGFRAKYNALLVDLNGKLGLKSLNDIDLNIDTLLTSAVLIHAGLAASRRFIAREDHRRTLELFIADLGKIQSSLIQLKAEYNKQLLKEKFTECLDLLDDSANEELISLLEGNDRTRSIGTMVSALSTYLSKKSIR